MFSFPHLYDLQHLQQLGIMTLHERQVRARNCGHYYHRDIAEVYNYATVHACKSPTIRGSEKRSGHLEHRFGTSLRIIRF